MENLVRQVLIEFKSIPQEETDIRIEYETRDGERGRVDLELATGHYRGRNLTEKVRAGCSLYAHVDDVSKLRRILGQRELTEILSL